ncbi:hypothetical protein DFH08DRAFT_812227 [Mycena albidolilacea]|uniref:Uncharacterized protein n=1 Tax=Mycena albidolilacea TaxID=1033008 RepID=A0AAD6ZU65_9AGAR|nr:hypothetical protein DFH08DRAFT_812227 [Mycena albidolilacea]
MDERAWTIFVNPERIVVRLPRKKTFDIAAAIHEVVANGLQASKIRKFSYMSRVTGVEYENRQNVTKSLKITQKIEISAYTVGRAVAFAQAAVIDSFGVQFKYDFSGLDNSKLFKFLRNFLVPSNESTKILGMSRSPEAKYEN